MFLTFFSVKLKKKIHASVHLALSIQWVEKVLSSYHTVNAKLNFFSYYGPFLEELASPLGGLF